MDEKELAAKLVSLEATDRNLEAAIQDLRSLAQHTDANTSELVDMFKKAKVIVSFLEFVSSAAAPIAWFVGIIASGVALLSHLKFNISFFGLFK